MHRMRTVARGSCMALIVMAVAFPATAQAEGAIKRTQHVHVKSLSDGHDIRGSSATLMRRTDGLVVRVHTRELTPGESVDVFWAIFNHPEACMNPNPLTGALCTPPDLFVPNTLGSLHYVATVTADAHGKLSYRTSLLTDSDIGCVGDPFPCNTLTNPFGAEVHSPTFVPNGGPGRQAAQFLPLQAALPAAATAELVDFCACRSRPPTPADLDERG
jgi:hypothetical protein